MIPILSEVCRYVCETQAAGNTRDLALRETGQRGADDDQAPFAGSFMPIGGIALHISRDGNPAPAVDGRFFCTFPLPESPLSLTGLPVHINAYAKLCRNTFAPKFNRSPFWDRSFLATLGHEQARIRKLATHFRCVRTG